MRAVVKNAPAEPTRARIAVGFSGESAQPSCACSGRAMPRRRAKPRNMRADFFMMILQLERYRHTNETAMRKTPLGVPLWGYTLLVLMKKREQQQRRNTEILTLIRVRMTCLLRACSQR